MKNGTQQAQPRRKTHWWRSLFLFSVLVLSIAGQLPGLGAQETEDTFELEDSLRDDIHSSLAMGNGVDGTRPDCGDIENVCRLREIFGTDSWRDQLLARQLRWSIDQVEGEACHLETRLLPIQEVLESDPNLVEEELAQILETYNSLTIEVFFQQWDDGLVIFGNLPDSEALKASLDPKQVRPNTIDVFIREIADPLIQRRDTWMTNLKTIDDVHKETQATLRYFFDDLHENFQDVSLAALDLKFTGAINQTNGRINLLQNEVQRELNEIRRSVADLVNEVNFLLDERLEETRGSGFELNWANTMFGAMVGAVPIVGSFASAGVDLLFLGGEALSFEYRDRISQISTEASLPMPGFDFVALERPATNVRELRDEFILKIETHRIGLRETRSFLLENPDLIRRSNPAILSDLDLLPEFERNYFAALTRILFQLQIGAPNETNDFLMARGRPRLTGTITGTAGERWGLNTQGQFCRYDFLAETEGPSGPAYWLENGERTAISKSEARELSLTASSAHLRLGAAGTMDVVVGVRDGVLHELLFDPNGVLPLEHMTFSPVRPRKGIQPPNFRGQVTASEFTQSGEYYWVAGLNTEGGINLTWTQRSTLGLSEGPWRVIEDIPPFADEITLIQYGFVPDDAALAIYGVGTDGDLHTMWSEDGGDSWNQLNLSSALDAAPGGGFAGHIVANSPYSGRIRILGNSKEGHLIALEWDQRGERAGWNWIDLSTVAGDGSFVGRLATRQRVSGVVGFDENGHVVSVLTPGEPQYTRQVIASDEVWRSIGLQFKTGRWLDPAGTDDLVRRLGRRGIYQLLSEDDGTFGVFQNVSELRRGEEEIDVPITTPIVRSGRALYRFESSGAPPDSITGAVNGRWSIRRGDTDLGQFTELKTPDSRFIHLIGEDPEFAHVRIPVLGGQVQRRRQLGETYPPSYDEWESVPLNNNQVENMNLRIVDLEHGSAPGIDLQLIQIAKASGDEGSQVWIQRIGDALYELEVSDSDEAGFVELTSVVSGAVLRVAESGEVESVDVKDSSDFWVAWDSSVPADVCTQDEPEFLRGNCNNDSKVDLSDAICILGYLFLGGDTPVCLASANTNGDSRIDLSDAVALLGHLFLGAPPPVAPFPDCGQSNEPTDTELGCLEASCL